MPADITSLTEGWLELESDPGKLRHGILNNQLQPFVLLLKVFSRFCLRTLE